MSETQQIPVPDFSKFKLHPVAAAIPEMSHIEFVDLRNSIEKQGQLEPIVVDLEKKEILDGRHRWKACQELGIAVRWQDITEIVSQFTGYHKYTSEISQFILHRNLFRRSINEDQRAQVTAMSFDLARETAKKRQEDSRFKSGVVANPLGLGGKTGKLMVTPKSGQPTKRDRRKDHAQSAIGQLAADGQVSRYKAAQAKELEEKAPQLAEQVRNGTLPQKEAMKQARAQGLIKPAKRQKKANGDYALNLSDEEATKEFLAKVKTAWRKFLNTFAVEEQPEAIQEIKKLLTKHG